MATEFRFEHSFPSVSLADFEKYLNHPDLNLLLGQMPGFRARDLVEEQRLDNNETLWRFKVQAGGQLPPAVASIIPPESLSWWETSRFVPAEHCIYWTIEPLTMKGKFEGHGTWQLSKKGKGTHRIIDGEFNVKIPFVGKVVETFIVNELKRNYEVEPDIQIQFYAQMLAKEKASA